MWKQWIFCYLGDKFNASGGCETAVTARTSLGWMNSENTDNSYGRMFSLKMEGRVYQTCVRMAMSYGRKKWCLRKNKVTILTGTERTMARAMRSAKLTEIKNTDEGKKMLFSRDRTRPKLDTSTQQNFLNQSQTCSICHIHLWLPNIY